MNLIVRILTNLYILSTSISVMLCFDSTGMLINNLAVLRNFEYLLS